eukprot:CAMPEP_0202978972 /NCGR_PEP_ID=MMETSP1396-20130829/85249_1 /ASSEMBLY_ACC=CAM_ASM_000872 /TAXON_ID= /ORGANISM="Pseudokeronopsis sp., Strain Brazil" /LENGTH=119 /DNA_ID=CAMNT_0049718187 /DNA_START=2679 /DNA_END=3035 /DNA_ORIENTATION=-
MQNYKEEVDEEQYYKPRLFVFPDAKSSTTIFDYDDLQQDQMIVVCARANPAADREKDEIYVWMGGEFEEMEDNIAVESFIEEVKQKYWGKDRFGNKVNVKSLDINRFNEEPGDESDEFN